MAGRKDIEAGRAHVTLWANRSMLTRGLEAASAQLQKFGSAARQIGRQIGTVGGGLMRLGAGLAAPFTAALFSLEEAKGPLAEIRKSLAVAVGVPLLPLLNQARELAIAFADWAKQNRDVVLTVAKVAAGVLAAGVVLAGIGKAVVIVGAAANLLAFTLGAVAAAIAFVTSPMGLLVAAIAAGTYAFFKFTDAGKATLATLTTGFNELLSLGRTAVGGIADAILAGEWQLAGKIAVAALKLAFAEGIDWIANTLSGTLGDTIGTIGTQLLAGDLTGAWNTTVSGMASAWVEFAEGLVAVFTVASRAIVGLWESAVGFLSDKILELGAMLPESVQELLLGAKITPGDVGQAQGFARDFTGGRADAMRGTLDSWDRSMQDRTREAQQAFADRTRGGVDAAGSAAAGLAAELDSLREQAARAREAVKSNADAAASGPAAASAELRSAASGTFSAAGALALGFGGTGGPAGRTAKASEGILAEVKLLREENARLREMIPSLIPKAA